MGTALDAGLSRGLAGRSQRQARGIRSQRKHVHLSRRGGVELRGHLLMRAGPDISMIAVQAGTGADPSPLRAKKDTCLRQAAIVAFGLAHKHSTSPRSKYWLPTACWHHGKEMSTLRVPRQAPAASDEGAAPFRAGP